MTRVEEWTNAETGVGAAIAAGSHLIKGNWALLVKQAVRIKNLINLIWEEKVVPKEKKSPIAIRRHKSPTRFERRVIILAPNDRWFW